jgi:cytochrome d ubiquinol oxidase subunit I
MDTLTLSRWQFGITTIYHFLFVPLTIGLSVLVAVMQTAWYRTRDPVFDRMARFWGKLFLINFAMGVVTGIVQEFQFGMNWSSYSRFVGDIFGAPLAMEGLIAFFLESTFIGLWIFGRDRLTPRQHLVSIWLAAIGTNISAYFILAANSWMQHPVGYELNDATGRAELTSIWKVVTNSTAIVTFWHTFFASFLTAGMFVLGISAWHLRRQQEADLFRRSAQIGLVVAFVSAFGVAFVGHGQAQLMTDQQPMKMAAAEALWETEAPAGFSIFAVGDIESGRNHINITIPRALSVLATNTLDGEVKGINEVQADSEAAFGPGDYRPPVGIAYWTFRLMIGVGLALIALTTWAMVQLRRGRLERSGWLLRVLTWAIVLPLVANTLGWIFTEIGRQPWIVYGVLTTADAVSPTVSAWSVATSLVVFTLLYGVLAVIEVGLLLRTVKAGPPAEVTWAPDDHLEPRPPALVY